MERVPERVKKQKALELMRELEFSQDTIYRFKKDDLLGIPVNLNKYTSIISEKIKDLVKIGNHLVYAVIPGDFAFRKTVSLLIVPDYKEDFNYLLSNTKSGLARVYAYVINLERDDYSEFGSILVEKDSYDNIVRVG